MTTRSGFTAVSLRLERAKTPRLQPIETQSESEVTRPVATPISCDFERCCAMMRSVPYLRPRDDGDTYPSTG